MTNIDPMGYLLLLIVLVYVFGKSIMYVMLFTGRIRFPFQNQFDPWCRGWAFGYLMSMAIITWWPITAPYIRRCVTVS
jgi:hypothetical protein